MDKEVRRFISLRDEENLLTLCKSLKYYNSDYGNVAVLEKVKISGSYVFSKTNIAIKIIYGYNGKALFDMFWTYPFVFFKKENIGYFPRNSHPTDLEINGITWQRWSRHYTEKQNKRITIVQHAYFAKKQIDKEVIIWKKFLQTQK